MPITRKTIFKWIILPPVRETGMQSAITHYLSIVQSTQQLQDLLSRFQLDRGSYS